MGRGTSGLAIAQVRRDVFTIDSGRLNSLLPEMRRNVVILLNRWKYFLTVCTTCHIFVRRFLLPGFFRRFPRLFCSLFHRHRRVASKLTSLMSLYAHLVPHIHLERLDVAFVWRDAFVVANLDCCDHIMAKLN
jgi:hypothetical protein